MLIQCDQRLSHALETKLSSLIDACRQKEPISLSLPKTDSTFSGSPAQKKKLWPA